MSKEHCLICGSVNHFTSNYADEKAWRCWACNAKFWIDDTARLEYMVEHNVSYYQAEWDLEAGLPVFATTA